jgi:hypothetical protein
MRGDKKSDTSISKFIRELGRNGIIGDDQTKWLIIGRDWIRTQQQDSYIEWIELRVIDGGQKIHAEAGLVPKPGRLSGRETVMAMFEKPV